MVDQQSPEPEYAYRVPEVDISGLTGLLETMITHEEKDGQINLPKTCR